MSRPAPPPTAPELGCAQRGVPGTSEEVLDEWRDQLHPQLHLPARLLKGSSRHQPRPQVQALLLLWGNRQLRLGLCSAHGQAGPKGWRYNSGSTPRLKGG